MAHTYIPNADNTKPIKYETTLQIMTILFYPAYKFLADATGNDEWNCEFYHIIEKLADEFHQLYAYTQWETHSRDYMLHFVENRLNWIKKTYEVDDENIAKLHDYIQNHPYYEE